MLAWCRDLRDGDKAPTVAANQNTLSCTNDEIFPDATCQPSRILLRGIGGLLLLLSEALLRLSGASSDGFAVSRRCFGFHRQLIALKPRRARVFGFSRPRRGFPARDD
jgi:hypothetical protein